MIVFPGEEYGDGKFDPDRVFVTYNAMGEADQSVPLPPANRRVSLNGMALGDCFGKSAAVAKDDTWAYTLVLKGGLQHVWVGTPAEAANGVGGGRIDGIVSVAVWAAKVGRKPHVSKRKPPPPPTPPNDATFWAEAEYVETCCFTQDPTATRCDFRDKLGELHNIHGKLALKDPNHPVVRMGLKGPQGTKLVGGALVLRTPGSETL